MRMIHKQGGRFKCRRCHGWAFPDYNRAWGLPPSRPRLVCASCGADNVTRWGERPPPVERERDDPLAWEKLLAMAVADLAALEELRDDPVALERYVANGKAGPPPRRPRRREARPGVPAWLLPPEAPAVDGQLAAVQLAFILADNGVNR